jgi:transcriptional regulator with XRE-family HTH domain
MIVRKLRLQRGWSQEQLAELSGVSTRTVQRIERGHNPGLESLKALAAVFDTDVALLTKESDMSEQQRPTTDEAHVIEHVRDIKGFYSHLISYAVVNVLLLIWNLISSPDDLWVKWVALGWGIGIVSHGINVYEAFNIFGPKWEKRQIEKKLGRKL